MVTVQGDVPIKLEPDKQHSRGGAVCAKGRAAPEIHDDRRLEERTACRDAAEREQRLLLAGEQARREVEAPFDAVHSRMALMLFADPAAGLATIRRSLRLLRLRGSKAFPDHRSHCYCCSSSPRSEALAGDPRARHGVQ